MSDPAVSPTRRRIRIEIPGGAPYEIDLDAGRHVLGRAIEADVQIDFGRVSQSHCAIERRDGKWWIVDLESRNGTTLGDLDVMEITDTAAPLKHGDVIRLGRTVKIDFIDPDAVTEEERIVSDPDEFERFTERTKRAKALLSWTWTIWFGSGILLGSWALLVLLENWIRT